MAPNGKINRNRKKGKSDSECSQKNIKNMAIGKISGLGNLRNKMLDKLKGARFRYLNEQLYLTQSEKQPNIFSDNPSMYEAYHEGYRQQVGKWPINPLDVIIRELEQRVKKEKLVIADFGCGEAMLAQKLERANVKSFDLIAANNRVTACDMRHTNLRSKSVDIAVFCLSLMSTSVSECIREANRVLKFGGIMKVAEVESRFEDIETFINNVKSFGFKLVKKDCSYNVFCFLDFKKCSNIYEKKVLPSILLKPCLYKKR